MTKTSLIATRQLPQYLIDAIRSYHKAEAFDATCEIEQDNQFLNSLFSNAPDSDFNFTTTYDQQSYISDFKISRLSPEQILDRYLSLYCPNIPSTSALLQLLSDATGQPVSALSDAILGSGSYNPCSLPPSPSALKILRFYFHNSGVISGSELQQGIFNILGSVPDAAFYEVLDEVKAYLTYFRTHDLPDYITSPD